VTAAAQLELEPVRFSGLKAMALSPAHYRAAVERDGQEKQRGRALHSIILGGKRVVGYPGKVRRGKEFEAFANDNHDAEILTMADYERAAGMAAAVRACPRAMDMLVGRHEMEIDWTFLGRRCQSHVDVVGPAGEYVTELKSTVSSHPDRFAWQSRRMAYHAQLAFYAEAVLQAGLGVPRDLYVVAVESRPPYVVTCMRLAPRALEEGRKCVRLWMERLLGCEASGEWPGYVGDIVPLDVPDDDLELTFGGGDGPDFDPETGEVAA